ncbi:class I SAM-dependent methyltransferase [Paraburkholderia sp. CNPSo 3076]|nr:class I SAM-dependent methyltransferase [Paraburkholderia sp. CNPSo 3076]MCX5542055.1 class I SAM-dependent methyltransferase [Paraburkholderia sp. CNPSo 3076]
MFECEGRSDLQDYVSVLQEHLEPDGVLVSHGIMWTAPGSIDSRFGLDSGAYLARYLFPDDELPDLGYALTAMRESGIEVSNIQKLRRHCVRTLRLWEESFRAKEMALRQLVNDRKYQTWRQYPRLGHGVRARRGIDLRDRRAQGGHAGQRVALARRE